MDWYKKAQGEQGDLFTGYPENPEPPQNPELNETKMEYVGYTVQPAGYAEIYFDIYSSESKTWKRWGYLVTPYQAEKIGKMALIPGIGNKAFVEAKKWRKAEWQVDKDFNVIPGTLNEDV